MKESHKVQSVRAVVEQTIADLKWFRVMKSNKIRTAGDFDTLLDCAIGLHNLLVLLKLNDRFDIPPRRAALPREHVIQPLVPENQVDLKIPEDEPDLYQANRQHIRKFTEFLPSAARAIRNALERGGEECVFYPTVLERGRNLYNGAYVLQLRVQEEAVGVWTIKYLVGASYSYQTHTGYVRVSQDNAAFNHICDCYSG